MDRHAAIMHCAIFVWFDKIMWFAEYFFLLLISLMVGHTANMQCAIFVGSAKIERFAKYFFLLLISPMVAYAAIIGCVKKTYTFLISL